MSVIQLTLALLWMAINFMTLFDSFSTFESARQAEKAFGDQGGRLVSLLGKIEGLTRPDVKLVPVCAHNLLGESETWNSVEFKATPGVRNLYATWQTGLVFDLLDRGLHKACAILSGLATRFGFPHFEYSAIRVC